MQGTRNDAEDIEIFIEWRESTGVHGPRKLHRNIYREPSSMQPYVVSELTPKDKGHLYRYRLIKEGAIIFTPLRVMDEETAAVVNQFTSLRPVPPWYKEPPKRVKKSLVPYFIWQRFALNAEDFLAFKVEAESRGWELALGLYDVNDVAKQATAFYDKLLAVINLFTELRSYTFPGTRIEHKDTVWESFNKLADMLFALQAERKQYAVDLLSWTTELAAGDLLKVTPLLSKIQELNTQTQNINLQQINEGLINSLAGLEEKRPSDANKLRDALESLKREYPIMRILTYDVMYNTLNIAAGGGEMSYDGRNLVVSSNFVSTSSQDVTTKSSQLSKVRKVE